MLGNKATKVHFLKMNRWALFQRIGSDQESVLNLQKTAKTNPQAATRQNGIKSIIKLYVIYETNSKL